MNARNTIAAALAAMILLSGCGGAAQPTTEPIAAPSENPDQPVNSDTPAATQEPNKPAGDAQTALAVIDSIDILILESFPVQINAMLKGNLPDGCTQIGTIDQSFDAAAKTFTLKVSTTRPQDMMCTQALVPFEKSVSLPVNGLPKGIYTVNANGKTGTFELQHDNFWSVTPQM